jgi:hypothetical protein
MDCNTRHLRHSLSVEFGWPRCVANGPQVDSAFIQTIVGSLHRRRPGTKGGFLLRECSSFGTGLLPVKRCSLRSKPRFPGWRRRVTSNGCQVRADITMRGSASGALVVPPSIWLSKRGLRCQPDVVDQMKLPTPLALAIATQVHVSHSPAIIRLRDRQLLPSCRQRPCVHTEIQANR